MDLSYAKYTINNFQGLATVKQQIPFIRTFYSQKTKAFCFVKKNKFRLFIQKIRHAIIRTINFLQTNPYRLICSNRLFASMNDSLL
jgi:hypothetical protein